MKTKLSIITINLNNVDGLKKTLKTIEEQSFKNYELIVVDGGSTDGSYETAKECTVISKLIHEKDNGIYHAMNKGTKLANSEWILFLNSGDYLHTTEVLNNVFNFKYDADLLFGNVLTYNEELNTYKVRNPKPNLNLEYLIRTSIPHQAIFFKKELFTKYGLYREDLEIVSDWEFYTRIILKDQVVYKYLPYTISIYDSHGISSLSKNKPKILQEKKKALSELFGKETLDSLEDLLKCKDELLSLKKSRFISPILKLRLTMIQLRNYFSRCLKS